MCLSNALTFHLSETELSPRSISTSFKSESAFHHKIHIEFQRISNRLNNLAKDEPVGDLNLPDFKNPLQNHSNQNNVVSHKDRL